MKPFSLFKRSIGIIAITICTYHVISVAHPFTTEHLITTQSPFFAAVMQQKDASNIVAHESDQDVVAQDNQTAIHLLQQPVGTPHVCDAPSKGANKTSKKWTVMIYMAADNDLRGFAARNIKQMAAIGSNENVNIVVHLDIRLAGNQKVTRWYYIDSADRIVHMNADDPATQRMDSGDPQTLITFCKWAVSYFPAQNYALIFWNHGTGCVDPVRGRVINPSELFTFNPLTQKLDLDRSIGFLDFIEPDMRGICWDDTTRNYLTNQKLNSALQHIYTHILDNQKFKIIGFDACLMAMVEIGNILKNYADIMVASQEVELGTGWRYDLAFESFLQNSPSAEDVALGIVHSYHKTYNSITNDYTMSATNLTQFIALEENIHYVAQLLLQCLELQKNSSVKTAINMSRKSETCTHFDEPSYIDLYDFYNNVERNLKYFLLNNINKQNELLSQLSQALAHGKNSIQNIVMANTVGRNLSRAKGLSIYFPRQKIHASYPLTPFCAYSNAWVRMVTQCL